MVALRLAVSVTNQKTDLKTTLTSTWSWTFNLFYVQQIPRIFSPSRCTMILATVYNMLSVVLDQKVATLNTGLAVHGIS